MGAKATNLFPEENSSDALDQFVGVWELLDSYDVSIKTGQTLRSRGAAPVGTLSYNIDGNMAVQVMNDGRPQLSDLDPESAAEKIKAAFENYTAYFGTFEINEAAGYVIHHIRGSLFPDEVGKMRKRFFQICGNRLTLTTPPFHAESDERVRYIVWERME